MPIQAIDLDTTTGVTFNGTNVTEVNLNGDTIWPYVPPAALLWNLYATSAPSGLSWPNNSTSPSSAWSATYGFQTYGGAANVSYPLRTVDSIAGYQLIQTSVWVSDNCSDASLAIFNGSSPTWNWGAASSRISLQCNCSTPNLYGTTTSQNVGANLTPGNWYTMHIAHRPASASTSTKAWVTLGKEDWASTGTRVGNVSTSANSYSGNFWVGVSSDFDSASAGASSTNFSAIRISIDVISGI